MAAAAVALARQRIASVSVELSKTRLYAPFAGNVVERLVDEGRVLGTGDPVMRIQERATPEIRVGIAGRAIDQLRPGQDHTLFWRDLPFSARLRVLLPLRATITRTVDALFDPLDVDLRLLPGDIVTLNLATSIEERGTWLPIDALSEGERGLWSVYVVTEADDQEPPPGIAATHRVVRRTVDVLYQEADRVFVDGALSGGERVITGGRQRIVAGQWVRLGPDPERTAGGRPS
jgi:RND family efflux transporter MFP subunit